MGDNGSQPKKIDFFYVVTLIILIISWTFVYVVSHSIKLSVFIDLIIVFICIIITFGRYPGISNYIKIGAILTVLLTMVLIFCISDPALSYKTKSLISTKPTPTPTPYFDFAQPIRITPVYRVMYEETKQVSPGTHVTWGLSMGVGTEIQIRVSTDEPDGVSLLVQNRTQYAYVYERLDGGAKYDINSNHDYYYYEKGVVKKTYNFTAPMDDRFDQYCVVIDNDHMIKDGKVGNRINVTMKILYYV